MHARNRFYHLNAHYYENRKHNNSKDNFRLYHARTTLHKYRKVENNLGNNLKNFRHISRKKNDQGKYEKSRIMKLEVENQVLRSRLDYLDKTLRKMVNLFKGPNK